MKILAHNTPPVNGPSKTDGKSGLRRGNNPPKK